MTGLTDARTQISQTNTTAQDLHQRLASMHQEILALERIHDRTDDGLLVIDRADDLRRSLAGPMRDQVQSIRSPLVNVESAYVEAGHNGDVSHEHAHTMAALSLQTARSARFLEMGLDQAQESLSKIAFNSIFDEDMKTTTSAALDEAVSAIEKARRSSYRVCEDLPMLDRTLSTDIDKTQAQAELPVELTFQRNAPSAMPGRDHERRHSSQLTRSQPIGISR